MLWRCRSVPRYKERGITVCSRWMDFSNFDADMGPRPPGATLDRIDTNGNYEQNNCRWASTKEQSRNKRNNRFVTYLGRTQCLTDWARDAGISVPLLRYRLNAGWSVQEALQHP